MGDVMHLVRTDGHGQQQYLSPSSLSFEETMTLAKVCAESGFFADTRQQAQCVVKILAGRELGFEPIASMNGIYIVQGKVSMSSNLIAAAIKRSGKYDYRVLQLDAKACVLDFYERGERVGPSSFTIEEAKAAGTQNLAKFARNMLFARALTNGAKWYCADVFNGSVFTPEELGATVNGEGDVIHVQVQKAHPLVGEVVDEALAPPPEEKVKPASPTEAARAAVKFLRERKLYKMLADAKKVYSSVVASIPEEHRTDDFMQMDDAQAQAFISAVLIFYPDNAPKGDADANAEHKAAKGRAFAKLAELGWVAIHRDERLRITSDVLGFKVVSWTAITAAELGQFADGLPAYLEKLQAKNAEEYEPGQDLDEPESTDPFE